MGSLGLKTVSFSYDYHSGCTVLCHDAGDARTATEAFLSCSGVSSIFEKSWLEDRNVIDIFLFRLLLSFAFDPQVQKAGSWISSLR
jgi:hypothetical protein